MELLFAVIRTILWIATPFIELWHWLRRSFSPLYDYARWLAKWAVKGLVATTALLLLGGAALAYLLPQIARLWETETQSAFERAHGRALAISLIDASGDYVGALDRSFEPDMFAARTPVTLDGTLYFPDHKSHHLRDAPPAYWACLAHLEDRTLGGVFNPSGVDFVGIVRIPYSSALRSAQAGRLRLGGGGSTIPMQMARSFYKLYPDNSSMPRRKWLEWTSAPPLYRLLVRPADNDADPERRLRQWAAMHLAHIQGTGRADVFGVEAAGRILFGKSAADLTVSEQFLLAASIKQPIKIGNDRVARAIWRNAVDRAKRCADALLEEPSQSLVLQMLAAMRPAPPETPRLAADLMDAMAAVGARPRRASSPEGLAALSLRGAQRGIAAELRDVFGAFPRTRVAAVRLTLNGAETMQFAEEMDALLAKLPDRWGQRFDSARYALSPDALIDENGRRRLPIPVVAVAADMDGQIVLFYDSGYDSFYHGLTGQRSLGPLGLGAEFYQPDQERREIASLGKIIGALALAEAGETKSQAHWNNRCLIPRDSRCFCEKGPCRDGYPSVPATEALGRSLNDAMVRRLASKTDGERLMELARIAGLTLPAGHFGSEPETMIALGWHTAAPRRAQMLAAAALDYAKGGTGKARRPRLIAETERLDPKTDQRWPAPLSRQPSVFAPEDPRAGFDLQLGGGAEARRYLTALLSAPITHPQGTLRDLSAWRAGRKGVRLHLAKTGTSATVASRTGYDNYDWWIAGAVEFDDGRRYSYVVAIGYGDPSRPFSRDLGGGGGAPIADLMLRRLSTMRSAVAKQDGGLR